MSEFGNINCDNFEQYPKADSPTVVNFVHFSRLIEVSSLHE